VPHNLDGVSKFKNFCSAAGFTPRTDSPSYVRVPVLSKTKLVMRPAILMRAGEMQNIFRFLSLFYAKITPAPTAAGSAGGTAIANKFRALSIIVVSSSSF